MEGTGETEQRREKTKQDGQCVFHEKKLMLEILKRVRKETPVVQSLPRRPRSAMLSAADARPFGYPSLDTDLSFRSLRIYPCCLHHEFTYLVAPPENQPIRLPSNPCSRRRQWKLSIAPCSPRILGSRSISSSTCFRVRSFELRLVRGSAG